MLYNSAMKPVKNLIPLKKGHKHAHNFKNIEGLKKYNLTIGKLLGHVPYGTSKKRTVYEALCSCGTKIEVRGADVVSGSVRSCGCLKKAKTIEFNIRTKTKVAHCTFSSVWQSYKNGSKKRGYCFEITQDEFKVLSQKNCLYCGTRPAQFRKPREKNKLSAFYFNGLDRVDNSIGYVLSNCVPCCGRCNYMKSKLSQKEFREHIKRIYKYFCK